MIVCPICLCSYCKCSKEAISLDFTKPLQTRSGRPVKLYATDNGGAFPVHGAIQLLDGSWCQHQWKLCGNGTLFNYDQPSDLVQTPTLDLSQTYPVSIRDVYGEKVVVPMGWKILRQGITGPVAFRKPERSEYFLSIDGEVHSGTSDCCGSTEFTEPRLILERK